MDDGSRRYSSLWQLRADVWSSIADPAERLSHPTQPPRGRPGCEQELAELLELAAPVERYWARPGPRQVDKLGELVAAGDYEPTLRAADPIARVLVPSTVPQPLISAFAVSRPTSTARRSPAQHDLLLWPSDSPT